MTSQNRDVILILQEPNNGPVCILRATQRTAQRALNTRQTGNPRTLTPTHILLASEPHYDQLLTAAAANHLRDAWYHPDALRHLDPDVRRDTQLEWRLQSNACVHELHHA